jgi:hypothetical protein
VLAIGLCSDDLEILRRAARSRWTLSVSARVPLADLEMKLENRTVCVVSASWMLHVLQLPGTAPFFSAWRGVVLLPATLAPEQQVCVAQGAPQASLVISGMPASIEALHDALIGVEHQLRVDILLAALGDLHSPFMTRVLRASIALPPHRASVPMLARALFMTDRTLRRRLSAYGEAAKPQRLLSWSRLLHVACCLRDLSCSLERASVDLELSGGANLVRLLRDCAGMPFSALTSNRSVDPVVLLLECLHAALAGSDSSRPRTWGGESARLGVVTGDVVHSK